MDVSESTPLAKPIEGFLLIDKPAGITSHDVVNRVRRLFGLKRVGHGGTLDPLATGLLILMLGSYTRKADCFLGADKTYLATLSLGVTTDTEDAQGKILQIREVGPFPAGRIEQVCGRFVGDIEQRVPAYSAVRIGGRRSYELARSGKPIPPRSRQVSVRELKILAYRHPEVDLKISCSKGTYIRTLCADIGDKLGCGAHMKSLRRIRIGAVTIDRAVKLDEAGQKDILSCLP